MGVDSGDIGNVYLAVAGDVGAFQRVLVGQSRRAFHVSIDPGGVIDSELTVTAGIPYGAECHILRYGIFHIELKAAGHISGLTDSQREGFIERIQLILCRRAGEQSEAHIRNKNCRHFIQNLYQHRTITGAACDGALDAIIIRYGTSAPFTVVVPVCIYTFVAKWESAKVAVAILVLVDKFVQYGEMAKVAQIVLVCIETVMGNEIVAYLTERGSTIVKAVVGHRFPADIALVIHILICTAVRHVFLAQITLVVVVSVFTGVRGGFEAEPALGHIVLRQALVGNKLIAQVAVNITVY